MPKKKIICKNCKSEKEIIHQGEKIQYPVLSCPNCGPDRNEWELWWSEYSKRWKNKKYWNNKADLPACVVGYFLNQFFKFYGHNYSMDVSGPNPYKNKDFVMAHRIIAMIKDPVDLRNYIRWVFQKRVKNANRRTVISLGFFANAAFVNTFLAVKSKRKILKRTSPLPKEFLEWCRENCVDIFEKHELSTWNDLNGLVIYSKNYGLDSIEGKVVMKAVNLKMLPDGPECVNLEI